MTQTQNLRIASIPLFWLVVKIHFMMNDRSMHRRSHMMVCYKANQVYKHLRQLKHATFYHHTEVCVCVQDWLPYAFTYLHRQASDCRVQTHSHRDIHNNKNHLCWCMTQIQCRLHSYDSPPSTHQYLQGRAQVWQELLGGLCEVTPGKCKKKTKLNCFNGVEVNLSALQYILIPKQAWQSTWWILLCLRKIGHKISICK